MNTNEIPFARLKGMTFASVEQIGSDRIVFTDMDGQRFTMYHEQDCCEGVEIESIIGDLADLVGTPVLLAEEATSTDPQPGQVVEEGNWETFTWTFYKLATIKGYVDIRWFGSSNGYYSESVTVVQGDERTWEW